MTEHIDEKVERKIEKLEHIDRKEKFPAEDILKLLPLKASDNILDVGAGTGYLSIPAAREVEGTVYALDLDGAILSYLATKAQGEELRNLETLEANFTNIPLEDGVINVALASLSLHEVDPLSVALEEVNRVMAVGGHILCLDFEKNGPTRGPRVSSDDMKKALIEAGFEIQETLFPEKKLFNEDLYIIIAKK